MPSLFRVQLAHLAVGSLVDLQVYLASKNFKIKVKCHHFLKVCNCNKFNYFLMVQLCLI